MSERVVITGLGCISCFGLGHHALVDAINSGRCGAGVITSFDTSECHSHTAALLREFDPSAFISPLKLRRVDAAGRVALACVRLLMEDAGRTVSASGHDDFGIALGTATAGLDSLVEYLTGLTDHGPTGVPAILFSNTVSNAPASLCALEYGLRGPNVTFNQREASSLAALAFGVGAIRQGRAVGMISGGVECLHETFFKVFDRFRALSPMRGGRSSHSEEAARPFDRARNGFVLGEGGYLLLIESASAAASRGARVYGDILGIGASASKTPMNRWPPDASGLARAMQSALSDANVSREDIAAIVATSNGSPSLDRIESEAIVEVFGRRSIPVASVKGAIGESGAAAVGGLITGLVSIAKGAIVPTVGLLKPDPDLPLRTSSAAQTVSGSIFLVNSVASGGTHYSVVVRAMPEHT